MNIIKKKKNIKLINVGRQEPPSQINNHFNHTPPTSHTDIELQIYVIDKTQ